MELTYDWKVFQNFFYGRKRITTHDPSSQIYLVVEGREIVSAFSEGEDLTDWVGSTYDEMIAEYSHREVILYSRENVDQWISSSLEMPHFYDQIQFLCRESEPQILFRSRFKSSGIRKHFLLSLLESRWSKFFPSTYGLYIRLDHLQGLNLFLLVQRGKVQSFYIPDFSSMIADRRRVPEDIVKYLSEKYLVPVQGLFLTSSEWNDWSETTNPWPKIASSLKRHREKLVPFRWGLAFLVTFKGYFGG